VIKLLPLLEAFEAKLRVEAEGMKEIARVAAEELVATANQEANQIKRNTAKAMELAKQEAAMKSAENAAAIEHEATKKAEKMLLEVKETADEQCKLIIAAEEASEKQKQEIIDQGMEAAAECKKDVLQRAEQQAQLLLEEARAAAAEKQLQAEEAAKARAQSIEEAARTRVKAIEDAVRTRIEDEMARFREDEEESITKRADEMIAAARKRAREYEEMQRNAVDEEIAELRAEEEKAAMQRGMEIEAKARKRAREIEESCRQEAETDVARFRVELENEARQKAEEIEQDAKDKAERRRKLVAMEEGRLQRTIEATMEPSDAIKQPTSSPDVARAATAAEEQWDLHRKLQMEEQQRVQNEKDVRKLKRQEQREEDRKNCSEEEWANMQEKQRREKRMNKIKQKAEKRVAKEAQSQQSQGSNLPSYIHWQQMPVADIVDGFLAVQPWDANGQRAIDDTVAHVRGQLAIAKTGEVALKGWHCAFSDGAQAVGFELDCILVLCSASFCRVEYDARQQKVAKCTHQPMEEVSNIATYAAHPTSMTVVVQKQKRGLLDVGKSYIYAPQFSDDPRLFKFQGLAFGAAVIRAQAMPRSRMCTDCC
jgi:hypothetical protein